MIRQIFPSGFIKNEYQEKRRRNISRKEEEKYNILKKQFLNLPDHYS